MNSKDGLELFETIMNTVLCKLDFYYIKIKTTLATSIMNSLSVPTDLHFKQNYVILFC